ncbi:hypothetical protein [Kitasatospora paranensis]|uniref:Sensor histidine kinase n=1 Tax=Kitasatospora paranensis TaxID=258053 RepID=A0ABW2GAD5_9ACTN
MQEWPEGPAADPAAARARYERDLAQARTEAREAIRADLSAAHLGLGLVAAAGPATGLLVRPLLGAVVPAAFAALFLAALAILSVRGARGRDLLRRGYLCTFGWGAWL